MLKLRIAGRAGRAMVATVLVLACQLAVGQRAEACDWSVGYNTTSPYGGWGGDPFYDGATYWVRLPASRLAPYAGGSLTKIQFMLNNYTLNSVRVLVNGQGAQTYIPGANIVNDSVGTTTGFRNHVLSSPVTITGTSDLFIGIAIGWSGSAWPMAASGGGYFDTDGSIIEWDTSFYWGARPGLTNWVVWPIVSMPDPTPANAGPDQVLDGLGPATLAATPASVGTGTWFYASPAGTFQNTSNPSTTFTPTQGGNNTLGWRTQLGLCYSYDYVNVNFRVPPTVVSPSASSITTTSATLNAVVSSDGGSTISERGFVYARTSVNANPAIGGAGVTQATVPGTTGGFSKGVTGLLASTQYSFKGYATNAMGTSYTTAGTFTTAPATVGLTAATQTVGESAGTVTVTAQLSTASGLAVSAPFTVSGTASNPDDHDLAAGSFSIPAGDMSASVTFDVVSDNVDEADETVAVTLGTPTNAVLGSPAQQTVTIVDDDSMLTVGRDGNGSGTVASSPAGIDCGPDCTEVYADGALVSLTASPEVGSAFVSWAGACTGSGACVVTMDAAKSVTATFTLNRYALTVSGDGNGSGTVASSPSGIDCGADCAEDYDHGTLVTLTPSPATGSSFTSWAGACSGPGGCVVTMDAVKSVTATFTLNRYTLTASRDGNGGGTITSSPAGIDCGGDCTEDYDHGTQVTLTPSPDTGSSFTAWAGACTGSGACVVTLDSAKSVTATFTLNRYPLTVSRDGNGSGSVASSPVGIDCGVDCTEDYDHGTLVTLTPSPATGSDFTSWSGACTGSGDCSVTMDAAKTVTASFTLKRYALSVSRDGTGSGAVTSSPGGIDCGSDCTEDYDHGTLVTLTPAEAIGSSFAGWSGACAGAGACVVTMEAAQSVTATFTLNRYALTVSRDGTGSGTVTSSPSGIDCGIDCAEDYDHDTLVTLTPSPAVGLTFTSWSGACTGSGACVVTMDAAKSVTATFTLNRYALAVSRDGTGSGAVTSSPAGIDCGADCGEDFDHGSVVTLTASPASGSVFTSWSGGCSGSDPCVVTMDATRSVTATFDALTLVINDVTVTEGDSGTTSAEFTVTLSAPSSETVSVTWATEDGSATAGSDYEAGSGTITFPAGSTSASVSVTVMGDTEVEADESFYVNLSDPDNATIDDGQGRAQIDNDDFVYPGSFFTLSPCRVLDTRDPGDIYGGALVAATESVLPVIGRCGVPETAKAISVNIAVTQPTAAGNLRLYPAGASLPTVSSINYSAGQTRANNAIIPLNDSGELAVWCAQASGTAHFILDVNGYFE